MKKLFIIISILSIIFSCSNEKDYASCLNESLINKLDIFKQELLDSLPTLKKDVSVNAIALRVLIVKQRIALSKIDFTEDEIKSLKTCFHNSNNILSDSLYINELVVIGYKPDVSYLLTAFSNCDNDYLMLFWLYHIIDRSIILVDIEVINDDIIYVNGERIEQFTDIRNKIITLQETLDSNSLKHAVTSIKANKDSVSMRTMDQIENELREVGALRINYSTLKQKK